MTAVDPLAFRRTMAMLPTGVTIVTTAGAHGHPTGFTANAVTSLSTDPPLVLVCVKKDSATHEMLAGEAAFAINILGRDHEDLARRFATPGPPRFSTNEFAYGEHEPPTMYDALGVLRCRHHALVDGGDHSIVVGRVVHTEMREGEPLIFYDRRFRHLPSA